jgi:spore coat polysaccharide biosynthesis protein SpsF
MRVVAIIQARLGSTRLPGKVLRPLSGRPMIGHVIDRALRIRGVDRVQMAVPDRPADRPLLDYLGSRPEIGLTRGPEGDVLRRFTLAAEDTGANVVMRINGDCPLLSPTVSRAVLRQFLEHREECDYASNTLERTYPRGLDVEVFSAAVLRTADQEATQPAEREHVTPFIWRHPERFRLRPVKDAKDHSHHRWTVDTAEDFALVERIYGELFHGNPEFDFADVLACLERHPDWTMLNRQVRQRSVPPCDS